MHLSAMAGGFSQGQATVDIKPAIEGHTANVNRLISRTVSSPRVEQTRRRCSDMYSREITTSGNHGVTAL